MSIASFKGPFSIGPLAIYISGYSHTAGAANETFSIGGQRVLAVLLSGLDSAGKHDGKWGDFTESVSGSTNTVTIQGQAAITSGYIVVFALAGV